VGFSMKKVNFQKMFCHGAYWHLDLHYQRTELAEIEKINKKKCNKSKKCTPKDWISIGKGFPPFRPPPKFLFVAPLY
jgi:hypothetical protein